MTLLPIDYSKTIIYKLCCNDTGVTQIYVGSTTDWTRRKSNHKRICNNETHKYYNFKNYQFIRANGGWDNWKMIQIEAYPCNNKREAEARERYWYEILGAQLNSQCPFITPEEKKECQKKYDLKNKEKKAERDKQYYLANKEKLAEQKRQYNLANKKQLKEYQRQYRLKKKAEKNNL